jgi:hypothetical protein
MDNDDARTVAENDQLKEEAYATYATWLLMKRIELSSILDALEQGPAGGRELSDEQLDFLFDMASVTLRDFAERGL